MKRPDELIKIDPDPAAGGADQRVPQDRQAPVRRHLQRGSRFRAAAGRRHAWSDIKIGLGGVAATPLRALATEEFLAGKAWTREVVAEAAEVLTTRPRRSATTGPAPPTAARCCGASLRKFYRREHGSASRAHAGGRSVMSKAHGPLADRPINPKVGLEISHESADLHVTGKALYTQDLVGRTKDTLHAWPVQAPHAHARVTGLRVDAAYAGARRGPGADRRRRARAERRRREARRAAVPQRGDVLRARRLLGARRDAGGGPAGRGGGRGRLRAAARRWSPSRTPSRRRASRAHQRTVSRGDAAAGAGAAAAHRFSGEFEFGGQEHFYLETNAALALVDENGQIFVQSSTQHPSETQDIVAHVLGLPRPPGHRAVPADGRRLRRQGVPAARPGRGRRARRDAHRAPGRACG